VAFVAPLALAAGVLGAGVSAAGALEQGQASANAANYGAAIASNNAVIAKQNADYAEKAGRRQAETTGLKAAAIGGKVKASQAASGIDVNSGSNVDVQQSVREAGKIDTETVLNNSELAAYGYRNQETSFKSQAELDKATAEQAPIGAAIGATGSLLSSASGLGLKWSQLGPGGGSAGGGSGLSLTNTGGLY
jgi:hypothetical protein